MAQYVLKRILYMIPTLFAISAVSFIIISLPPGDFVDSIVAQARYEGEVYSQQRKRRECERYMVSINPWLSNI